MATYLSIARSPWISRPNQPGGPSQEVLNDTMLGDDTNAWIMGELLKASSGVIAPVRTDAGVVTTTEIPAGTDLYIAAATLATKTAGIVEVVRVRENERFIGYLLTSNSGASAVPAAPTTIVDNTYALYQDAAGQWGVDIHGTSDQVVKITRVQSQILPFMPPDIFTAADGNVYNLVEFKFLSTVLTD